MRKIWFLFIILVSAANLCVFGSNVIINTNRKFLFGDVLSPLCSIKITWNNKTSLEVIELFHEWEKYTSSQISSFSPSDYRKAMPCFPGPNLTSPNNDLMPLYPSCDVFVNISKTTMEESEDLLRVIQNKNDESRALDISVNSVINSLSSRLQNLIDYLPEGSTKVQAQKHLSSLTKINLQKIVTRSGKDPTLQPQDYGIRSKFNPSRLLHCLNISSLNQLNLANISSQSVGAVICLTFGICSFSDVTSNACLSSLNITETQFYSIRNKTIGEMFEEKFTKSYSRSKRRPKPKCSTCTDDYYSDDVTMFPKMDKREEIEIYEKETEGSGSDSGKVNEEQFQKALDYFAENSDSKSNELNISESTESENLDSILQIKLNSSLLKFVSSLTNDSAIEERVAEILPAMDSEFTVSQLLRKLRIQEIYYLVSALKNNIGIPFDNTKLRGGSRNGVKDAISKLSESIPLASMNPTNVSLISEIIEHFGSNSTRPSIIETVLESNNTIPNVINRLKENLSLGSELFSKLNLSL